MRTILITLIFILSVSTNAFSCGMMMNRMMQGGMMSMDHNTGSGENMSGMDHNAGAGENTSCNNNNDGCGESCKSNNTGSGDSCNNTGSGESCQNNNAGAGENVSSADPSRLVKNNCSICHGLRVVVFSRKSDWSYTVNRMNGHRAALNMTLLTDSEKKEIVRYLNANYSMGRETGIAKAEVEKHH